MNPTRILVLILLLLGAGVGSFFLLNDGPEAPPPEMVSTAELRGGKDAAAMQAAVGEDVGMQRTAYEAGTESQLPPAEKVALSMLGRVTDPLGNPIAGAKVLVQYRQGFGQGGPGFGGRGNRGGNNGGPGGQGAPGGTGMQDLFGRGRRGQELTPAQQAQMEDLRSRFRPQPVGEPVLTAGDGSYRLSGDAFSNASLTIAVTHPQYAPAVERRDWQQAMGELKVADIVLHAGVVVTGTVVDDGEHPVVAAEVRFEEAQNDNNMFGPPGGGNGRNGRGGRGGRFGGPGGPGGRGGFGGETVADLIGVAKTDLAGSFRLGPVPAEAFQLVATAENFLDGHSRQIDPADGQQLPPQRLMLVAAAALKGIVHDAAGQPIANARITGEVSQEAMMAQFRAQREAAQVQAAADRATNPDAAAAQDQQNRRGRRGQGGPGNADFARMREVMTASETVRSNELGEFEFKKLPRAQVKLTAEHPRFLAAVQEPIDVQRTPLVVIVMPDALTVSGKVVDAVTGTPIENFGIAARRTGQDNNANQDQGGMFGNGRGRQQGQNPQQQGRGGRGGNNQPQQPDPAALAQAAARDKGLQDKLGPAARLPGRTPQPSAHAGGEFTVEGLQGGEYGFDIDAPGYIRTATPAIKVDAKVEGLVLQVEKGAVLQGRVELGNHTPVSGVTVELLLPDPPADVGQIDIGGRGGMGGPGGRGGPGGGRGGMALARASSGADGHFSFDPVRPGNYRLRAQKQGLMDFADDNVVLAKAGTSADKVVVMTAGAAVAGVVRNMEQGVNLRVTLTHATDRSRHSGSVDAVSGEYKIEGLPAGSYFASLTQFGGDEEAMKAMIANAMAQREKQDPDLTVAAGASVRYDFVAGPNDFGSVLGTVYFNNQPGTGMQVRLTRVGGDPTANSPNNGNNGNRGQNRMSQMADQLLRGTVAADGSFALTTVPPGSYEVEVQRGNSQGQGPGGGRGGRGGRGGNNSALYKQTVEVVAQGTQRLQVDLHTSDVEFRITLPEAIASSARVRIGVALTSEAANQDPQQWRRLASYQSFFLNNGTTGAQQLAPGLYSYQIAGRGIQTLTGDFAVSIGQNQVLPLTVAAAPEPAPGTQPQPGNPGDPATQGNGGRGRNRGQGGQNGAPGGQPGQQGGRQRGGRQPGSGNQPGGSNRGG